MILQVAHRGPRLVGLRPAGGDRGARRVRLFARDGHGRPGGGDRLAGGGGERGRARGGGARVVDRLGRDRAGVQPAERQQPVQVALRARGVGEGGQRLRPGLLPLGLGLADLRQAGGVLLARLGDVGLRLGQLVLLPRRLDLGQESAGLDVAVVDLGHADQRAGDLRGQAHDVGVDEGVVGGFELLGVLVV